jgi:K+-transporting ATPase ATPase C chain
MREIKTAIIAVVVLTVVLGVAYPLGMTAVAKVAFPGPADGSLIKHDGKTVGSKLIGQDFSRDTGKKDADGNPVLAPEPRYFQSRPSATGYSASATFFNNQGPNQRALADQLKGYVAAYLKLEKPFNPGLTAAKIPADAVTTSASGVDPQISEANARIQARRVAAVRKLPLARVLAAVEAHASRPLLGLAGPKSINVLELNLALDDEERS